MVQAGPFDQAILSKMEFGRYEMKVAVSAVAN